MINSNNVNDLDINKLNPSGTDNKILKTINPLGAKYVAWDWVNLSEINIGNYQDENLVARLENNGGIYSLSLKQLILTNLVNNIPAIDNKTYFVKYLNSISK